MALLAIAMTNRVISEPEVTSSDQAVQDILAGMFFLFWAALGGYGLVSNDQLLASQGSMLSAGPALIPGLTLAGLCVGGVLLLLKGAWSIRAGYSPDRPNWHQHGYAVAMVISLLALVGSMQAAGFLISTFLFCSGWLLTLSRRIAREGLRVIGIAISCAALISCVIYLVFVELVKVPLP
ncbi:tripartite tricarboxylate transporter TctB family protein [Pseudomonas profundi]|uniref:tripartite tricarboxylate transporter TctB family protein n=1 Tax=Pseudomonas profundi TaxID=1981513 RepID=UPI0012390DB0|nr:tripartite tricarboxylate transporter TctB family protein [Pseudomonas profundi]